MKSNRRYARLVTDSSIGQVLNVTIEVEHRPVVSFMTDSVIALAKLLRDVTRDNVGSRVEFSIHNEGVEIPEMKEIYQDLYEKGIVLNQF